MQIRSYLLMCLWMLGFPDQAAGHITFCHRHAADTGHVNTICYGALHRGICGFMSRQDDLIREANGAMYQLGEKHELKTWQTYGLFADILIRSRAGDEAAIDQLPAAMEGYTDEGNWLFVPFYKTEQVRELIRLERIDDALREARAAEAIAVRTSERWMLPELFRLQGQAHLHTGERRAAAEKFNDAIAEARRHEARSWELRAAIDLAELLAQDDDTSAAIDLLQPIYDWFTEGFDTADLKQARALLDGLG